MANRRLEPVSYRPFRVEPALADGLLSVQREGGELERKVSMGMARLADEAGRKADLQAEAAGLRDSRRDAIANTPTAATLSGGQVTGTASVNGQAGHVRGAQGGNRVVVPPEQIRVLIEQSAARHGVDPHALSETTRIESNFNPNAKNPKSTAGGILQFIDSTASEYGLTDKFDAAASLDAGARLMKDNTATLTSALGRTPTAGELYLAHQQGGGGAAKLLANPNAKASDIVGVEAVLKNGGTLDMSAGQFSTLWTSKVSGGDSYQKLPTAASVGPMSVTPVREPVTLEPGKAGTWRPTGRDTVYGRAYDTAGEKTYLEMADAAMVENQTALYDAYSDDPAMLQKALGEGLTADLRDNVFEEIAPEYTAAYQKRAAALMSKSREAQRERQDQQVRMQAISRIDDLENRRAQQLAGYKPGDPLAASALADTQAAIDANYDSAVARGVMDAEQAGKAKKLSRSTMTVGFYVGQTKDMSADQIDQMRAEMQRDYGESGIDGVTADDWTDISKELSSAAATRRTQDATVTASLKQRGDDIANRVARGQPVAPEELSRFQLDIGPGEKNKAIAASTFARMRVADALRKQPIGEVERNLASILKGGGETVNPEDTEFARKTIAEFRQAVLLDPLGKAEAIGLIPPVASIPVDGTATPEQIAGAVSYRRGAADAVAKHFGISPRYFRPGEADAVLKAAEQNPEALVVFTQSVRDAFGRDASKALSEFSESGPALAHAAGLSIATGDVGIARDVATTLSMKRQKQLADLTPETGRKLNGFGASAVAGAFLADPRTQNAVLQTAQLLFEKDASRMGIDPAEIKTEESPAQTLYLKSLDRALGGRTVNGESYGGIDEVNGSRIVTPSDMAKGEPQRLVETITDDQLKLLPPIQSTTGYPVTSRQLRRSQLVSTGDGMYRVALGDPMGEEPRYLTRPDGAYWTLDIRALQRAAIEHPLSDRIGGFNPFGWQPEQPQ
ncbi:transglycosylase SLT domain-containing protein [Rhizobium sp. PL01]|uniref:transglycosylase SLT domain-containing protein n=1 Tax=Rhizobium sp. PL01 TaxID=3085631 RepID=UPI002982752C|nr:transglycosylase SLT domain-containing protein [Rhizobium sp. PL01]MDW5313725.1 transglycosylase SLT domain-containing protein [Rhizobium sp. PL01]